MLGLRSLNNFESAYARVLYESADSAAQQLAQQIKRDFKWPVVNLLEQVDHPAVTRYDVPNVSATLEAKLPQFPTVSTVFMWGSGHPTPPEGPEPPVLFFPADSVSPAAVKARDMSAEWSKLGDVLKREAFRNEPQRRNYALSYLTWEDRKYHVLYHFIYDQSIRNALQGFIGFFSDTNYLRDHYLEQLLSNFRAEGRTETFPRLAVAILDEEGTEVVRAGRPLTESYDAEARFPFLFFDADSFETLGPLRPALRYWTVRTGYDDGAIAALARRETAEQRWAWALVGVMAVMGILLSARATTHDLRLSQMKSEFVASVSHELKTPLAKIQLFAETLDSGRVRNPEKASNYYRVISVQSRKLSFLIGQLLDFSKLEAGVRQYPLEELDLSAVVRSSLDMFDYELSRDRFTLEIDVPDTEVPVLGNAEGLQQLFSNLISNALKYSGEDRFLRVAVTTDGGRARIDLSDHGIGMSRQEQKQIFRKFYRSEGASSMAPGSGIGLAIAHDVIKAHNGRISVSSVPGQGSTFTVELPLASESEG